MVYFKNKNDKTLSNINKFKNNKYSKNNKYNTNNVNNVNNVNVIDMVKDYLNDIYKVDNEEIKKINMIDTGNLYHYCEFKAVYILTFMLRNSKINYPDCNKCINCLDKRRNGGTGRRKKGCLNNPLLNK